MSDNPTKLVKLEKPRTQSRSTTIKMRNQQQSLKLITQMAEQKFSHEQLQELIHSPHETLETKMAAKVLDLAVYSETERISLKATEIAWNRIHGKVDLIVSSKRKVTEDSLPDDIQELQEMILEANNSTTEN